METSPVHLKAAVKKRAGYLLGLKIGLWIVGSLLFVLGMGRLNLYLKFSDEVAELFVNHGCVCTKVYI